MSNIIGRKHEQKRLQKVIGSSKSEFVAIYGRRRVGKTFLIREFFKYTFDFQLTGLANATTKQQLNNFYIVLRRKNVSIEKPSNWIEAFQLLIDYITTIKEKRKKIIFIDELPWLDTPKSDFVMALEHFWNSWATNRKDIVLVTCGSAASWMINMLINNRGGLHNRVTARIRLEPFTLSETELMLQDRHHVLDRYQILQIYMVMGGIPYYLEALSPEKSAAQNIDELCFKKGALLATEFDNLFPSLFRNSEKHEAVVYALSAKTNGLTRNEIIKAAKIPSGGSTTKILLELEESGFISKVKPFNKKKKDMLFRLSDFYSNFYIRFIQNKKYDEGNWTNNIDNPAQRAWSGYVFEQICLSHIKQIKRALGINGILSSASSWKSTQSKKGSQIDIVIDRRDQIVNLVEVKFSISSYTITKAYADNLRNKVSSFKEETKTRKTIFLTMITTFGLKKNMYSSSLIQNIITMDDLFN